MRQLLFRIGVVAFALLLSVAYAAAVDTQSADRGDPVASTEVDHRPWADFLLRYLRIGPDGVHRVGYGRVTVDDLATLGGYIESLSSLDLARLPRAERAAVWINLYNALVVRLVVQNYPIGRITDIGPNGPFDLPLVEVDGRQVSLSDIRERNLAATFDDPRVQYALSCGAIGCPNLPVEPFLGTRLERQLNDAAMAFINDERCVRIEGDRLILSSLFRWQADAFGGSDRAVIRHLMAFAEPGLAIALQRFDRPTEHVFDWRLNDATLM